MLKVSFLWVLLTLTRISDGHVCFLEQRYHFEHRMHCWALPSNNETRCQCTQIFASPQKGISCDTDTDDDYYWVDDDRILLLTKHTIWNTEYLKDLLDCHTTTSTTSKAASKFEEDFSTSQCLQSTTPSNTAIDFSRNYRLRSSTLSNSEKDYTTSQLLRSTTQSHTATDFSTSQHLQSTTMSNSETDFSTSQHLRSTSTSNKETDFLMASHFTTKSPSTTTNPDNDFSTYPLFTTSLSTTTEFECSTPLGLETGAIPDSNIIASSYRNAGKEAKEARLNSDSNWVSSESDSNPWIQVTLLESRKIHGLFVQGSQTTGNNGLTYKFRVTGFQIQMGSEVSSLEYIRYSSNQQPIMFSPHWNYSNLKTPVYVTLPNIVTATVVRLEPKLCYRNSDATTFCLLSFEIVGC